MNKVQLRASAKKKYLTLLGLLVFFALTFFTYTSMKNAIQGWLISICFNVILAVSLNLTVGILGDLSLGHAGFMCVGAFAGTFVSKVMYTLTPDFNSYLRIIIAIVVGGIAAGIFGLIIGATVLRLSGDYLAIVTLAFGEIIWKFFQTLNISLDKSGLHFKLGTVGFTESEGTTVICNGAQGITNIGKLPKKALYIVSYILMFITVWVVLNLIHSQKGRSVKAIRDNKIAAESCGVNIKRDKLTVLIISAFFAGIAGVLYAFYSGQAVATQASYGYTMSINILVFVVLGGMNSTLGAMIAAAILTVLPGWLRFLSDYRMLIYSIILILIMLFRSNETLRGLVDKVVSPINKFLSAPFKKRTNKEGN